MYSCFKCRSFSDTDTQGMFPVNLEKNEFSKCVPSDYTCGSPTYKNNCGRIRPCSDDRFTTNYDFLRVDTELRQILYTNNFKYKIPFTLQVSAQCDSVLVFLKAVKNPIVEIIRNLLDVNCCNWPGLSCEHGEVVVISWSGLDLSWATVPDKLDEDNVHLKVYAPFVDTSDKLAALLYGIPTLVLLYMHFALT